jgi:glycolate oxidase FAD binding subunit
VNTWAGQPLPLSGTAWLAGRLLGAAFRGAERRSPPRARRSAATRRRTFRILGSAARPSPRVLQQPAARSGAFPCRRPRRRSRRRTIQLIEWGGGQRWIAGELDAAAIRKAAQDAGGHATLFRNGDKSVGVFHPLQPRS